MNTSEYPVWLAVPPDDREKMRTAAGQLSNGRAAVEWNKDEKLWFARPGADLDRISEWLPDRTVRAGGGDPGSEFLDVLTQAGLIVKGMPVMDGTRQRVSTDEDKNGKKSGVYCGFLDRRPGGWFINYHRADSAKDVTKWVSTGGEADPVASMHIRAAAKQSQEDAARERAAKQAERTAAAKKLYDRLPAADPSHPYLVRKGITPTPEIRQTRNGALVVPFFNAQGDFKTLQYIPEAGEKLLFKDAPKHGHFLVVGGPLVNGQPIQYAEGYATARSLNIANERPVVMTIDAGNMVAVAQILHQQFPSSPHMFMADFDHAKAENKGWKMANEAAALVGGRVAYPAFNEAELNQGFTDFNDLHHSRGLDAVRDQTAHLFTPPVEVPTVREQPNLEPLSGPDLMPMAQPPMTPESTVWSAEIENTSKVQISSAAAVADDLIDLNNPHQPIVLDALREQSDSLFPSYSKSAEVTIMQEQPYVESQANSAQTPVTGPGAPEPQSDAALIEAYNLRQAELERRGHLNNEQKQAEDLAANDPAKLAELRVKHDAEAIEFNKELGAIVDNAKRENDGTTVTGPTAPEPQSEAAQIEAYNLREAELERRGGLSNEQKQAEDLAVNDPAKLADLRVKHDAEVIELNTALGEARTNVQPENEVATVTTVTGPSAPEPQNDAALLEAYNLRQAELERRGHLSNEQKQAEDLAANDPAKLAELRIKHDVEAIEFNKQLGAISDNAKREKDGTTVTGPTATEPQAAQMETYNLREAELERRGHLSNEQKQAEDLAVNDPAKLADLRVKHDAEVIEFNAALGEARRNVQPEIEGATVTTVTEPSAPEPQNDAALLEAYNLRQAELDRRGHLSNEQKQAEDLAANDPAKLAELRIKHDVEAIEFNTQLGAISDNAKRENEGTTVTGPTAPESSFPASTADIVNGVLPAQNEQKESKSQAADNNFFDVPEAQPALVATSATNAEPASSVGVLHEDLGSVEQRRPAAVENVSAETMMDSISVGPRIGQDEPPLKASDMDKDLLLTRITTEAQKDQSVLYKLDNEPAFVDRGARLEMAQGAGQSDEKIVAALLTAARFYRGQIELTGSDAFKAKAVELIAHNRINVSMKNPAQQLMLDQARQALNLPVVKPDAIHGAMPTPFDPAPPASTAANVAPNVATAQPNLNLPEQHVSPTSVTTAANTVYAPLDAPGLVPPVPLSAQSGTTDNAHPVRQASQVDLALHTPSKNAEQGVTGKVISCGKAPFRFDPQNNESVHIKLRTKTGVQTFWGKELAGLLREARIEPGRMATLQYLGEKRVTVKQPVKEDGVVVGFQDREAHRNQWSMSLVNNPSVRTGDDQGVKLVAYDAARFAMIQNSIMAQLNVPIDQPPRPTEGLFWMTPNGQGSAKAGDELSAPRPVVDSNSAGKPVMSSWSSDGQLDMALFRGDGPYLQGVVRQGDQYQHVLVSLPGKQDAPPMVINQITEQGLVPIGVGNGINRSGGEPVAREHIAFKLEGDPAVRIGKLDFPADVPPALHDRLGFDQRWKDTNNLPKSSPAAAPVAEPSAVRPS